MQETDKMRDAKCKNTVRQWVTFVIVRGRPLIGK